MTSLLHTLNTGTLAAWLSVAGFGTVGVLIPDWQWVTAHQTAEEVITECLPPEIALGEARAENPAAAAETPETPAAETTPETPEIPAMPEIADLAPLPEIPKLPEPAVEKPATKSEWSTRPKPSNTKTSNQSSPPSRKTSEAAAAGGTNSGMSDGARLAAGRMPAPSYPAAARRAGQTGTVTIAFTVDSSGKVISAHAVNPSPWPLLNEEAVRTVRRWKFPPGGVMKLQRPIVFQLR